MTPNVLVIALTLSIFWLPPNSKIKITIGGIATGIEIVQLIFLGWQVPPGGTSKPKIGESILHLGIFIELGAISHFCLALQRGPNGIMGLLTASYVRVC